MKKNCGDFSSFKVIWENRLKSTLNSKFQIYFEGKYYTGCYYSRHRQLWQDVIFDLWRHHIFWVCQKFRITQKFSNLISPVDLPLQNKQKMWYTIFWSWPRWQTYDVIKFWNFVKMQIFQIWLHQWFSSRIMHWKCLIQFFSSGQG